MNGITWNMRNMSREEERGATSKEGGQQNLRKYTMLTQGYTSNDKTATCCWWQAMQATIITNTINIPKEQKEMMKRVWGKRGDPQHFQPHTPTNNMDGWPSSNRVGQLLYPADTVLLNYKNVEYVLVPTTHPLLPSHQPSTTIQHLYTGVTNWRLILWQRVCSKTRPDDQRVEKKSLWNKKNARKYTERECFAMFWVDGEGEV